MVARALPLVKRGTSEIRSARRSSRQLEAGLGAQRSVTPRHSEKKCATTAHFSAGQARGAARQSENADEPAPDRDLKADAVYSAAAPRGVPPCAPPLPRDATPATAARSLLVWSRALPAPTGVVRVRGRARGGRHQTFSRREKKRNGVRMTTLALILLGALAGVIFAWLTPEKQEQDDD